MQAGAGRARWAPGMTQTLSWRPLRARSLTDPADAAASKVRQLARAGQSHQHDILCRRQGCLAFRTALKRGQGIWSGGL